MSGGIALNSNIEGLNINHLHVHLCVSLPIAGVHGAKS